MKVKAIFENRVLIVLLLGIINSIPIIWDYFHGGVPVHYLLHSKDFPGFSNWWGLLTIPVLVWIAIVIIANRKNRKEKLNLPIKEAEIINGFVGSLIYGIIISILWEFGFENILQYLILVPIVISLFKRIYFLEYLIGFVLGMVYIFGGVLPIIIGIVLMILSFLAYNVIRKGFLFFISKFNNQSFRN